MEYWFYASLEWNCSQWLQLSTINEMYTRSSQTEGGLLILLFITLLLMFTFIYLLYLQKRIYKLTKIKNCNISNLHFIWILFLFLSTCFTLLLCHYKSVNIAYIFFICNVKARHYVNAKEFKWLLGKQIIVDMTISKSTTVFIIPLCKNFQLIICNDALTRLL